MSINNITRTNTIDEWRIQTNQSAGELNKLETGNYTKTAGSLRMEGSANVVIDAQGTSLQVTNTALFSTNVTVGREISLGSIQTATGNLGVGGVVSIYGPNTALYVANSVVSNGSVIVKNNIVANNLTVNSNTVIVGTANLGYLGVANSGVFGKNVSVGTTLSVTGNTTVGNLTTANMVYAGTLRTEGRTDIGGILHVADNGTFDNDLSVAGDLSVDGNFTLTGDIVYDTDILVLSAATPVTAGYAYIGINRGNTTTTLGTVNANAYIRWTETDKIWQIRDVDNADTTNAFSKILTANTISANLQSVSNTNFPSTWVTKNYADNSTIGPYLKANAAFAVANAASNTFVGTDGSTAISSNGAISFSSGNGLVIKGSANTITVNTSQDLRTTASPSFAGLTLTAPLAITEGGTGAQSAGGALTALLPSGTTAGYVLTTGGPGNFYWAAGGGGSGGSAIPGTAINTSRLTYTATSGQTTFSAPVFTAGSGQLKLFINGVRQHSDFTETTTTLSTVSCTGSAGQFSCASTTLALGQAIVITGALAGTATISQYYTGKTYYVIATNGTTTFTLSEASGGSAITTTSGSITGLSFTTGHRVVLDTGASTNDLVMVEVDGYSVRPYYANNIAFTPTGNIPASSNTIQLGMESLESRKANLSGAVFTGGISAIAPTTVDSSTNIPTTAWVKGLLNTTSYTFASSISGTAANASALSNLVIHTGRNNEANKVVRTDASGYLQTGYINSSSGDEGNNSNPTRVWGTNGSDSYLRTYLTSALSVNYAASAGSVAWTNVSSRPTAVSQFTNDSGYQTSYGSVAYSTRTGRLDGTYVYTLDNSGWFSTKEAVAGGYMHDYYGGGIGMQDSSWMRIYGSKGFYVDNQILATSNITAYYSDERLKERLGNITGALESVMKLNGFRYVNNELAKQNGYTSDEVQLGLSAQEVEALYPEIVTLAPFDMKPLEDGTIVSESGENYKTLDYSKLVPVLVEAIKELKAEIEELKGQIK